MAFGGAVMFVTSLHLLLLYLSLFALFGFFHGALGEGREVDDVRELQLRMDLLIYESVVVEYNALQIQGEEVGQLVQ